MVDLLGYADAGCLNTLTTTADVSFPVPGDSWSQDCTGGVAGTGSDWDSKWSNRLLQQVRAAIRMSDVPLANAYDYMLSWAMQSGAVNWGGAFGGSANALTATAPNSPQIVQIGTVIRGIAGYTNTGPTTFNWAGLGAGWVTTLLGTPCVGGEFAPNYRCELMWDGVNWVLISPPPNGYLNPFTTMDVGAVLIGGNFVSSAGNPSISIGELGTCTNPGANEVVFAPTSGGIGSIVFYDTRAWGGTVPGNWEITQMGQVGPVYTSGSAISTVVLTRIS